MKLKQGEEAALSSAANAAAISAQGAALLHTFSLMLQFGQ
jgi:hypothetical protein